MDKGQFPLFAELTPDADTHDSTAQARRTFAGTANPRYLRVIQALMIRPRKREEIDRIAGASNGPDLIGRLRDLGLELNCIRTPGIDRDGYRIRFGVYAFHDGDRRAVNAWLSKTAKVKV